MKHRKSALSGRTLRNRGRITMPTRSGPLPFVDLSGLTVAGLRAHATSLGIAVPARASKSSIVSLIESTR